MILALVGIGFGLVGAFALTRLMTTMLLPSSQQTRQRLSPLLYCYSGDISCLLHTWPQSVESRSVGGAEPRVTMLLV